MRPFRFPDPLRCRKGRLAVIKCNFRINPLWFPTPPLTVTNQSHEVTVNLPLTKKINYTSCRESVVRSRLHGRIER